MAIVSEPINCKLFDKISRLCDRLASVLENYCQSKILQEYCISMVRSLFYANLIMNFFHNLDRAAKELKIPQEKVGSIQKELEEIKAEVDEVLNLKHKQIDEQYYNNFKMKLDRSFPEFTVIISEIEHLSDFNRVYQYLMRREVDIRKSGQPRKELGLLLLTLATEKYVEKEKGFPVDEKSQNTVREIVLGLFDELAERTRNTLRENTDATLQSWKATQEGFESRLYKRWQLPIDLLHSMIILSLEAGERKARLLSSSMDPSNKAKWSAIIRIHARSVQISREILTLIESGYADGALARWRSLHELSIISLFLSEQGEGVSQRYLDHYAMKSYRDAIDYQRYCTMLGGTPPENEELDKIRRHHDDLIRKYGNEFEYRSGWEWIPSSILKDRTFKGLERIVKMDKYRPYYNMSANAVHGGAKGLFYGLGLLESHRNSVLAAGPSNYGLADPIQNAAISLSFVMLSLLTLVHDFESLLALKIITKYYVKEIGSEAVKVQKEIEKEEEEKTTTSG